MTSKKRKRGRPSPGAPKMIQKHVFMDRETADMLRELCR